MFILLVLNSLKDYLWCLGTSTSSAKRKSFFSEANLTTSCIDFRLWMWPAAKMTCQRSCYILLRIYIHRWALFLCGWTWGISRVDDVQSHRFTDSFRRFQCSVQLLHLQLPAVLLAEVVGNGNGSQSVDGHHGVTVARHWGQHTGLRWALAVRQQGENVLMHKITNPFNLKLMVDIYICNISRLLPWATTVSLSLCRCFQGMMESHHLVLLWTLRFFGLFLVFLL